MSGLAARWLRRVSTALNVAGVRAARPYGFHIPYRHASTVQGLDEQSAIAWLDRRMQDDSERYLELVRDAAHHNARFTEFRSANPNNVNQPRFNQQWFSGIDGAITYTIVRATRPQRIVEVGSGHSTRFLRQAIDDAGLATYLHSIDPQPRRAIDALCSEVTRTTVDRVPVDTFAQLAKDDILFLDASHIAMPGTDVDYVFSQVLPMLQIGVRVHVHDVFLPFGYPKAWRRRGYNEQLMVIALLAGGSRFDIVCPNAWLRRRHPEALEALEVALVPGAFEGSFWLQVTG